MLQRLKLRQFFSALTVCMICLNPLWADDTEIFFSTASDAESQPNLLFVLDGSGSMNKYDCDDGSSTYYSCGDDTSDNATTTRLSRMVSALTDVLDQTSNVNVGLMRFSYSDSGSRVIYPVRDIDLQFCNGSPCNETTVFDAEAWVASSADDAYEDESGVVVLDVPYVPTTIYDGDKQSKIVGIRFPHLQIPQGATIDEASIEFTSLTDTTAPHTLNIKVEDVADAQSFEAGTSTISNRNWWVNSTDWTSPPWTANETVQTASVQSFLQRIVSKPDWCGGNAVGFSITGGGADFLASSFDRGSNDGPRLRVRYRLDNIPASGGCTTGRVFAEVTDAGSDSKEVLAGSKKDQVVLTANNQRVFDNQMSAFSFDLNIPKDASIKDALLTVTTYGGANLNKGDQTTEITLEDSASPAAFQNVNNDLTSRSKTGGVLWTDIPLAHDSVAVSPNFGSLVESVVAKPGWVSGNRINVFLNKHSDSDAGSTRTYFGFSRSVSKAAKLEVTFYTRINQASQLVTGPVTDVREKVKEQLNSFIAAGGTPTVGGLIEAQRYFQGGPVGYGLKRRHSGSASYSRVSHPESYTGGTVVRQGACSDNDLNNYDCRYEYISGNPTYISPIEHECQSNHVILLTDGVPTSDSTAATTVASLSQDVSDKSECATSWSGQCGEEMAKHMFDTDTQPTLPSMQNITTHAIGFNFSTDWLRDVASSGNGGYYTANSASDLLGAVNSIISNVKEVDTTFVAPGATIDQFSRLSHRNDIYMALFQPSLEPGWKGNLKKFVLGGTSGNVAIYDSQNPPEEAVDAGTGTFEETARSFWLEPTADDDGNDSLAGGAAALLDPADRNLLTYFENATGGDLSLTALGNRISATNGNITNVLLGVDNNQQRYDIIDWLYGQDLTDEDQDSDTSENRFHMGDPLHSSPILVDYQGAADDELDSVAYVGTNEGFLHAIDTESGEELFAYMPESMLYNLRTLYDGSSLGHGNRIYGIDGEMTLQVKDTEKDGIIDDDDEAFLYFGLRRGGRDYYGLDISKKTQPEFKWKITGGSNSFPELGETWSKPTIANIKVGTERKKVLIFAGGYDNSQDNKITRQPDTMGRAIYIVEAEDPTKVVWIGSGNSIGATEVFPDMTYSIPSDIAIINEGADNLVTQFYVGDMGGRIWRFDVHNGETGADLVDGGIIAELADDDSLADARRFYHQPDLSLSRVGGKKVLNVAIGSGYQAHPLNRAISDKLFVFQIPYQASGHYGIKDEDESTAMETKYKPIKIGDLFDTTNNLIGQGNDLQRQDALDALSDEDNHGWYITMERAGEKILGQPSTLNGVIRFTSYIPGTGAVDCGPDIGSSVFWAVMLEDGTPDSDSLAKGVDSPTKVNRNQEIPGGGIAPAVQTLYIQTGDEITRAAISGTNVVWNEEADNLMKRWYWSELPD